MRSRLKLFAASAFVIVVQGVLFCLFAQMCIACYLWLLFANLCVLQPESAYCCNNLLNSFVFRNFQHFQ